MEKLPTFEQTEKSLRKEELFLDFEGEKIRVIKETIEFPEKYILETGGVEGYDRWTIDWDEISKLHHSEKKMDDLKEYDDAIKYSHFNSDPDSKKLLEEISNALSKLSDKMMGKSFIDSESLYHIKGGAWGGRDDEGFFSDRMLLQKPFDPMGAKKVWEQNQSISQDSRGKSSFYLFKKDDNSILEPGKQNTNLAKLMYSTSYEEGTISVGEYAPVFLERNVSDNNKRLKILTETFKENTALLAGTRAEGVRSQHGLSLARSPKESAKVYSLGVEGQSLFENTSFEFNYENYAFQEYLKNASKTINYIFDVNKSKLSNHSSFSLSGYRQILDSLYEMRKYIPSDPNSETPISKHLNTEYHSHPLIPVVFGDFPAFHWAHCNRAFIPSKNGLNFIKMKSNEESIKRYEEIYQSSETDTTPLS